MEAVNLDCMDEDKLEAITASGSRGPYAASQRRYAAVKLNAIACRLKGCIAEALQWEADCDRIYNQLPASLRW